MKGVLFTELIEIVEDLMGPAFASKVIDDARLKNTGAYTASGSCPYQDMFKLMETLKLHPGAEIPSLKARLLTAHSLKVSYSSPQKMGDLIEGLLIGCIGHFNEPIEVQREDLPPSGSNVCSFLQKRVVNE